MPPLVRWALLGLVVSAAAPVSANPFRPHHPGPPYCFPDHHPGPPGLILNPCCYGYFPTQWKRFPPECVPPMVLPLPHVPVIPTEPAKPAKPIPPADEPAPVPTRLP